MRTTLVPCCMRARCLPRKPLLKSRVGRGARGSSSTDFFILFSLGGGSEAGSDEANGLLGFSVDDEEEALSGGCADGDEARFVERVLVVGEGRSEWVFEDGHGLSEGDAVLLQVAGGLLGVVLEDLTVSVHA